MCSVVRKSLLVGVACFFSVRWLEAKKVVYCYIFCGTNEYEVIIIKLNCPGC